MAVSSVSSSAPNANFMQIQKQGARAKEVENDNDKDDLASKLVSKKVDVQKATEQKVVVEKTDVQKVDSQKTDEKKVALQTASRASVNTRGQVVGSNIDTQA
jgi:hypothetical protein